MTLKTNLARFATSQIDQASPFGDRLEKAKFICYPGTEENLLGGTPFDLVFHFNPSTIKVQKSVQFESDEANQTTKSIRYAATEPVCLELGELWFDTYDTRESVREKYIDTLESLCDYVVGTHYPRVVVFVYGEFSQRTSHKNLYLFHVASLSVEYTMFLPDGTPVRAKVAVNLKQVTRPDLIQAMLPKESPDHARIYTIKRGDTLQAIARFAYDDPREWRRIADANKLDDPSALRPGAKLMLPPILK